MTTMEPRKRADARADRTWQALGEVAGHPVVAAWRDQARKARPTRRTPWAVAAVLAVAAAGAITYGLFRHEILQGPTFAGDALNVFETKRGERRKVMLPDGSSVTLNTSSRVRLDYDAAARRVHLLEGEALFEVASDARRPFTVDAAGRQVLALGTAFGVRVEGSAVRVTLVEGRVAVDRVEMNPGEQLLAGRSAEPVIRVVDVQKATSWQSGWLVFDRDTVGEAIAEVSRYTREQIVCDDPRLARLHVSGTLKTGDVEGFLRALAQIHPFNVERKGSQELRLVWREQ